MTTGGDRRWGWGITGLVLLGCAGCAAPPPGLWPPEPGAPVHAIVVSVDTWHAVIALPEESSPGPSTSDVSRFRGPYEEWGYAERAWYLEGRRGVAGILRVLFRSTPGIVEVGRHERVWADRGPPPTERFVLRLSETGYRRLRRHLEASLASREPVRAAPDTAFYPAAQDYNLLFNQCHQYAARALREAGLPLSAVWAVSRAGFVAQLEDVLARQESGGTEGTAPP